jgi:hypothetical protein
MPITLSFSWEKLGGGMMCSDWNRPTNSSETAAMTQWIFGFITGYDAAIRPNPSDGSLNALTHARKIQRQI